MLSTVRHTFDLMIGFQEKNTFITVGTVSIQAQDFFVVTNTKLKI
jgi:hypothetical protein